MLPCSWKGRRYSQLSMPRIASSQTVWASVGHSQFDLPGTSVGASWRRPGDNAGMETTASAVKTATGDSGTVNGSMMEVEEETSVTESGAKPTVPVNSWHTSYSQSRHGGGGGADDCNSRYAGNTGPEYTCQ